MCNDTVFDLDVWRQGMIDTIAFNGIFYISLKFRSDERERCALYSGFCEA